MGCTRPSPAELMLSLGHYWEFCGGFIEYLGRGECYDNTVALCLPQTIRTTYKFSHLGNDGVQHLSFFWPWWQQCMLHWSQIKMLMSADKSEVSCKMLPRLHQDALKILVAVWCLHHYLQTKNHTLVSKQVLFNVYSKQVISPIHICSNAV